MLLVTGICCLLLAQSVYSHSVFDIIDGSDRDRRMLLDDLGGKYSSIEQFTSCGLFCVPAYNGGDLETCCLTGETGVCQGIQWDLYRQYVGSCKTTTPQPTTVAAVVVGGTSTCDDDTNCRIIMQSLQGSGQDVCLSEKLRHFCNKTCSLCPGMSQVTATAPVTVDPCRSLHCQHGQCVDIGSSARCHCDSGYIGQFCNIHDPCSVQPCANGICVPLELGAFRCVCQKGYVGFLCDSADPCNPDPCGHGTCTLSGLNAVCTCESGYTGFFCDRADPCDLNPCLNGKCSVTISGTVRCDCDAGYSGTLCENGP